MNENMREAAKEAPSQVIDGEVWVKAQVLMDIAATVAATHYLQSQAHGELTGPEKLYMIGQQQLCLVMMDIHAALVSKHADEIADELLQQTGNLLWNIPGDKE